MIAFTDLTMMFGSKILWSGVNLTLPFKKRYAVVGSNGSGKSTLLRLLSAQEESTKGEVKFAKEASIGFLQQDQFIDENLLVIDLTIKGNYKLWKIKAKRNVFYAKDKLSEEEACELGMTENDYLDHGGYEAESTAAKLLLGLGIDKSLHYKQVKMLSGGYRIRALLAQALFNDPNILLLDEPTNHLDITSIAWLEKYLKHSYQGTLILISHDKSFLNNIAQHILDIDYADIRMYKGNYDAFTKQKKLYSEQKAHQQEITMAKIENLKSFISRFGAKATKARQAKSKQKMIEKIEVPDIERSSCQYPKFDFNFALKLPQGRQLLEANDLTHGFSDDFLFTNLNFKIHQGEKILIIGPNGVGKSTLLKLLLREFKPMYGEIKWNPKTYISYISQQHHDQLDTKLSLRSWLLREVAGLNEAQCRKILAQMLFRKEDVDKKISVLSGGECTRLLLAKAMIIEQNFLIMDEPTNHLDMESIESLVTALQKYKGTLLLVSHDRHFASAIANRILVMHHHRIIDFSGTYDEYIAKNSEDFL